MTQAALTVEIRTEELPPRALRRLGEAFGLAVRDAIASRELCDAKASLITFATPRRLAVQIDGVVARAADRRVRERILPVSVALDAEGKPSAALTKKLAALGLADVSVAALEREGEGKNEAFFHTRAVAGAVLSESMTAVLSEAIGKLPIPKVMSYQIHPGEANEVTVEFARPAHGLVVLHGSELVPASLLGLDSQRTTQGHRFLSIGEIALTDAREYAQALRERGRVVASFEERRAQIVAALASAAGSDGLLAPEALIDEVTALVEWPRVIEGRFEAEFLEVPHQCLILTMQQNQRYFALTDARGRVINRFLFVSNIDPVDTRAVVVGNERVLRARLADAKFFFEQDKKRSLESRLPALDARVYHNKLGSEAARTVRIEAIALDLARILGIDIASVARAARLAKADLVSEMVGEFPELQGVMGRYYAENDGEPEVVAVAIEEHYRPRFAGDSLPSSPVGIAVAMADKLEALVGLFGIGSSPTGDRDPYGLRRQALGVLRMLVEKELAIELSTAIGSASRAFAHIPAFTAEDDTLRSFFYERLRGMMRDYGFSAAQVESVISRAPERVDLVPSQLRAVAEFSALPEAESLIAANKRIGNILKKSGPASTTVARERFELPAEAALYDALIAVRPQVERQFDQGDFTGMLQSLAALRAPVDQFFDDVMVMAEDLALRHNRLALLAELHLLMNRFADLSKLAG